METWIVGWTNANISRPETGLLPQKEFSSESTVDFQTFLLLVSQGGVVFKFASIIYPQWIDTVHEWMFCFFKKHTLRMDVTWFTQAINQALILSENDGKPIHLHLTKKGLKMFICPNSTVDGSEIPFPTTWDGAKALVNSGISTTVPSDGAGFRISGCRQR